MVLAARVTEDHVPEAVAAGAGAAVAAPAAVAAIPVAVAEDRPATRLVQAALAPVPKPFYHWCFCLLVYSLLFLPPMSFSCCHRLIFNFCISCPDVLVDDLGM